MHLLILSKYYKDFLDIKWIRMAVVLPRGEIACGWYVLLLQYNFIVLSSKWTIQSNLPFIHARQIAVGVQCLAQEQFDMLTGRTGDQTDNPIR